MSRKRKAQKREKELDFKYSDPIIGEFINKIMLDGKKSVARRVASPGKRSGEGPSRKLAAAKRPSRRISWTPYCQV